MNLEISIIFGLITLFGWGISKVTLKPAIDKLGSYHSLVYNYLFVVLTLMIVSAFRVDIVMPSFNTLINLLIAIIVGALSILFFFNAMQKGKVSIVSPIAHSATIITIILSLIFYNESLDGMQIVSIIFLILGVLLLSFRYSGIKKITLSRKLMPGAEFALLTMIGWGLYFFIIKPIVLELGPLLSILYIETGITIAVSIPLLWKGIKRPGNSLRYCAISGVLIALASFCYNLAIENAAVSIIFPIANSSILVTVIASHIFLKEKIESNQKMGILITLIGLILISF